MNTIYRIIPSIMKGILLLDVLRVHINQKMVMNVREDSLEHLKKALNVVYTIDQKNNKIPNRL